MSSCCEEEGEDIMGLSLEIRVVAEQSLEIAGGVTESVFPRVEALLLCDQECRKAIDAVSARKDRERYQSLLDFLFCELFIEWRDHCFRFYEGESEELRVVFTVAELTNYEALLLVAIELARTLFREQRRVSWSAYQRVYRELIASV